MASLVIKLQLPDPGSKPAQQEEPGRSPEEEVQDMLHLVEADKDSSVEWKALMSLYSELARGKKTPRIINIMKMIHPVLSKYGYHCAAPSSKPSKGDQ